MSIDKYSQLKIASNILDKSMQDFATEAGVTPQALRGVCNGDITSSRVSKFVDEKIETANEIFNDHLRERKMKAKTV